MLNRRLFLGATALSISVILSAGSAFAQDTKPIKIGLLTVMSGPAAFFGKNSKVGAELAIKEINDKGGIAGRKIELVIGDDQGNPTAAVNEARRLALSEKVDVIVGPAFSQLVLATAPILTEAKVLSFSIAGAPTLTPQVLPYHFSVLSHGGMHAAAAADLFQNVAKIKTVAIIADDTTNSKETLTLLKSAIEKTSVKLVGEQTFQFTSTDMTPQLLQLKRSNPDMLYILSGNADAISTIMAERNELDWNVPLVGNSIAVLYPSAKKKLGPDAYKNTLGQYYKKNTICPGEDSSKQPYGQFYSRLKAYVGDEKLKDLAANNVGWVYDQVQVFKTAVESNGGKTDGPTLASWIEQNGSKLDIVSTSVSVSKDNHFFMPKEDVIFVKDVGDADAYGMRAREGCM